LHAPASDRTTFIAAADRRICLTGGGAVADSRSFLQSRSAIVQAAKQAMISVTTPADDRTLRETSTQGPIVIIGAAGLGAALPARPRDGAAGWSSPVDNAAKGEALANELTESRPPTIFSSKPTGPNASHRAAGSMQPISGVGVCTILVNGPRRRCASNS